MKLFEILDTQVYARVRSSEPSLYSTMAKIGGRNIYFSASRDNSKGNVWTMQFSERTVKGLKGVTDNFGKTGHGHELEVFSFVLNSLRGFVALYKPHRIKFLSSKTEGRSPLYSKMVQRVSLPGYSFEGVSDAGKYDEFMIVRDGYGKGHSLR